MKFFAPALLMLFLAVPAAGQSGEQTSLAADPVGVTPSNHQDSARLTHLSSAVMPADGLWSVGVGGRTYSTVYLIDGFLNRVSQKDVFHQTEIALFPWLNVWGEVPWRMWADGAGFIPASGSGLGDGN